MNTKTWKNRVLSVALTVIMVISMLPLPVVAAAGGGNTAGAVTEVTGSGSAADEVAEVTGGGSAAGEVPDVTDGDAAADALTVMSSDNAANALAVMNGNTVENAVAEVTAGGTTKQYTDIDAAFAAAQGVDSATVKLLTDVTISHDGYSGIELEKGNITLDLNGNTLSKSTCDDNGFYSKNAVFWLALPKSDDFSATLQMTVSLTVQDSSADGNGKIVQPNGGPAVIATFNTKLTVNGGTIENTSSVDHDNQFHMTPNCAVLLSGGGKAVINGGTLSGMRGVAVTGYITKEEEAYYKGKFGIDGYNNETYGNELTVTGGEISGTSGNALIVYEKAKKIELSGGTFSSNDTHSIWVADSKPDGVALKGDAASLLKNGYRYQTAEGVASAYSTDGNGVVGNTEVKERPANEYTYIGADGKEMTQANCTEITDGTEKLKDGWYVVKGNVTRYNLSVSGTVNLILCDGAEWKMSDGGLYMGNNAVLNIYAQSAGTGKLTATGVGTNPAIGMGTGKSGGTLNIYGGVITATSYIPSPSASGEIGVSENRGAAIGTCGGSSSSMTVNINGGTVTAKATYGAAAIGKGQAATGTVTVTIADGMKCVKTDDLTAKATYNNTNGDSVTISKCNDHQWTYTENDNTHTATCALCSKSGGAVNHSYTGWTNNGNGTHTGTCVCGAESTGNHTLTCTPNDDGLTHSWKCSVCGYAAAAESHDFNQTGEYGQKCDCGAYLRASYDGQNYASLSDAVAAATKNGGTVKLEMDVGESITVTDGMSVTIDLNRKTWFTTHDGGNKAALTVDGGSVTVKNGTMQTDGMGSACTPVVINGGSLTVGESVTVLGTEWDSNRYRHAIEVNGGELTLSVGTVLYCGMKVSAEGKTLADYLPEGTAFVQIPDGGAGSFVNGYVQELTGNFKLSVEKHTHFFGSDSKCACGFVCRHPSLGFTYGVCGTCGYVCPHTGVITDPQNGNVSCTACFAQMAVKVTTADGNITYYAKHFEDNEYHAEDTLKGVFNEAPNDSTVTLLADDLPAFGWIKGKNITLELNGKNLIENNGIVVDIDSDTKTGGRLFVCGEGSSRAPEGSGYPCTFRVLSDSELRLNEKFSGDYGTIYLEDGMLTSDSTNMKIGALVIQNSAAQITLKGGQFGMISIDREFSMTADSLLERFYAFKKADGSYVPYDTEISQASSLENVTVVKCDHELTELPKGSQYYNHLYCPNCDEGLEAVLTTADGKINGYKDLTDSFGRTGALSVAETTPGCTVTMYLDAEWLSIRSTAEGFTLDANDCTIALLELHEGTLTVKNATITGSKHNGGFTVKTYSDVFGTSSSKLTLEDCVVQELEGADPTTLSANGPLTLKNTVVYGKTSVYSFTDDGLTVDGSVLNGEVTVNGNLIFKSDYAPKITVRGAAEISGGTINELDCSGAASLTVSGGQFGKITAPDGKQLIDCLKDGYAFRNNAGLVDGRNGTLEDVYVEAHTHGEYKWDTATHALVCACGHVKETDKDLPTFGSIAQGGIYYQNILTFTVEDTGSGIREVKDGDTVLTADANGSYTITADNAEHIITATDIAGNSATVTVWVYKIYKVTFADGEGYTIKAAATVNHNTEYTFRVTIGEGYTATDTYAVKVNNESVTGTLDGSAYCYTVTAGKVNDDLTITVSGVADITAPEAEIAIGTNTFKSFLNKITLGLFFRKTQTVTVTASDKGSGVKTVEYLLSAKTFDRAEDITGDWKTVECRDGKATFDIAPGSKGSVYVRVTDESGNAVVINSDGVVLYTDSTADTGRVSFSRLAADDVSFKVNLNGNTVKGLSYSGGEIDSTQYVVDVNGTITLKNDWLKTLEAGEYTITVTYNPMGESYVEQAGNETPATTTVSLEVLRNTRTVDFAAPDAIYDGKAYDGLTITAAPADTTIRYKVRDAADDTYSAAAPEDAGSYTVQISTPQDADYNASVFTGDFVISRKEVTITGTAAETTRVYNGSTTAEITGNGTLNGVCDGDELRIVKGEAAYADKKVGNGKTVTFTGFTLGGADKDNYALKAQPASVTADITVREVSITGAAVAAERVYNGSTTAEIANIGTLDGKCDGDKLDIVAGNAAYADKKVGRDKTVTFTGFALDGADKDNYALKAQPASTTADITPRELTVENLKIKAKQYDGTDKAEIDGTPTLGGVVDGDTLTLISGTPAFSSTAAGESVAVTFTSPFALEGDEETLANYTLVQPTGITADIAAWITDGSEYSVSAGDWINSDFTVTARIGCQIGLTDKADGDWTDKLTASDETGNGVLTFYVKNANGVISSAVSSHYRIDKTAPAGTITINGDTAFQKFLDTISFGQVFKGDVTVKLTAVDEASGVKTMAYYKSDRALSLAEVKAVTDWKQGDSFSITARDKEQFVIYACITDNAGNVTYISSDGAKFDIPAPESTGGESGNTGSGSGTEAGTDAGNGSGSSTGAGANTGNGSGSSTGTGANTGNGSGSSTGTGANTGNGSGSSTGTGVNTGNGGGSSTGTGEVMPYIKGENGKEGWEVIRLQLEETGAGETVTVVMNGTTVVPRDIFDSIRGEDVTIVLDMGDGISWKINGRDIEGAAGDIDLGVTMGAQAGKTIPVEVINNLTGERSSMKLTLAYDGEFGFTARLSVNMEAKNAGLYANLFYYNGQTGELEFISAGQIGEDGSAELAFTHASDYMIVIDTVIMNGSTEESADGAESADDTESTETGNVPAPEPEDTGDRFPWNYVIMIIAGICIVMIVCGAVWYVSKKKDAEE